MKAKAVIKLWLFSLFSFSFSFSKR